MLFDRRSNRLLPSLVLLSAVLAACGDGDPGGSTTDSLMGDDDGASDDDASESDDDASDDDAPAADDDATASDDDGPADDVAGPDPDSPTVPTDAEAVEEAVSTRLSETLEGLADTAMDIEETADMGDSVMSGMDECGGLDPIELNLQPVLSNLNEGLRELSTTLQEDVFREDLVESDDGTTVVYYMDPAIVCGVDDVDCQEGLTETPVRFAVTQHEDDSIRIVAQIGEERREPATMVLTETSISGTADLAEILEVARQMAGPDGLEGLPDTLSGVIQGSIVKQSEQSFSMNFGIIEALSLSVAAGEPGQAITASLQAAPNALSVMLDGVTSSMVLGVDWNALDVSVPGSEICGDDSSCGNKERQGAFSLHLDGVSMGTVLEDNASELTISNVGLGDATSSLNLNADPLVEVDVNPDDGRRFAVQLQDTAGGTLVTFEPKLDFALATTLLNLSEAARMEFPRWLDDEIFEVTLGGDARGQILVPDACAEASHAFEVTEGTLTMSASSLDAPVEVEAGMCLVQVETELEDPHPFQTLGAGACE